MSFDCELLPGGPYAGLPAFYWPGTQPLGTFGALPLPALMITLVSFLETASSAKVDNARAGKLWNENQDLIGQGLASVHKQLVAKLQEFVAGDRFTTGNEAVPPDYRDLVDRYLRALSAGTKK